MLDKDAAGTSKQKAKACCTSKPHSEGWWAHVHLGLGIIILLPLRCEGSSLRVWLISLVDTFPCFTVCKAYGNHQYKLCDQVQPADADLLCICFLVACASGESMSELSGRSSLPASPIIMPSPCWMENAIWKILPTKQRLALCGGECLPTGVVHPTRARHHDQEMKAKKKDRPAQSASHHQHTH